jgi:hypothetical protein
MQIAGDQKAPPVGALTSENRDLWTDVGFSSDRLCRIPMCHNNQPFCGQQARQALISASPINAASLERIESAIIIVALDDHKPVTREDTSWQVWVGDGRNRFFDKHQRKLAFSQSCSVPTMLHQSSFSTMDDPAFWVGFQNALQVNLLTVASQRGTLLHGRYSHPPSQRRCFV